MKIFSEIKNAILERFTSSTKPSGIAGQIGYNTSTNHPEFYNGTSWIDWVGSAGGITVPNNTVFVATNYSNVYPYYSSINAALSGTSGTVSIVVFPGTYSIETVISGRTVYMDFIGFVNILNNGYLFSITNGSNVYISGLNSSIGGGHPLSISGSNFYCDVNVMSIGLSLDYGNVRIRTKMSTSDYIITSSSSYVSNFNLEAVNIQNSSGGGALIQFVSNGSGGIVSCIKCLKGIGKIEVTDNVSLRVDGGDWTYNGPYSSFGNAFLCATGSNFNVRLSNVSATSTSSVYGGIAKIQGTASVGTIDMCGCKLKDQYTDRIIDTDTPSGRFALYGCRMISLTPGTVPFRTDLGSAILWDSTTKYDSNQF